jgi:predicted DNA-binding transcriptional regulator YafY
MALNKLALIRYKTIDDCLRNRARKWTLDQLIERVSETLYEYEGIMDGVSKRTIQLDLQTMRSSKLYSAPIIVTEKKYYTYEDPKFSITQSKLTAADVQKMNEVVGILKHLNGFNHFGEMSEMIAKLENNLHRSRTEGHNVIQFESNALLKGLNWIDPIYKAIVAHRSLQLEYRSFRSREARLGVYYPYLLKEYRNRWFLIVKTQGKAQLLTLALDRIEGLLELPAEAFIPHPGVDFDHYFDNVIGVTKSEKDRVSKVILEVSPKMKPYILTKPLHPSQTVLKEQEGRVILSIDVVLNFELEREILGFGAGVKVLSPRILVKRVKEELARAVGRYGEVVIGNHILILDKKEP